MSKLHPRHPGYVHCLCVLQGVCPGLQDEITEARNRIAALDAERNELLSGRYVADRVRELEAQLAEARVMNRRLLDSVESFEKASEVAMEDAERAEVEIARLRDLLTTVMHAAYPTHTYWYDSAKEHGEPWVKQVQQFMREKDRDDDSEF